MFRGVKLIPIILVWLCAFSNSSLANDKRHVFVSIVPQKYFVQQIGKELVDVQVMVQPGAGPELAQDVVELAVGVVVCGCKDHACFLPTVAT